MSMAAAQENMRQTVLGLVIRVRRGSVCYIGGSDTLPAPLDKEAEARAIEAALEGDMEARNLLIEHNLRLVVFLARKFENTGLGIEDLISIGTIGLIKAVNSFNPEKNIKLATYASRCIENEILMVLRRTSRRKGEVSFDEPLNVDWDGNELLLSDVLGTDPDIVSRDLDMDAEKSMLMHAVKRLSARERAIVDLRYGLSGRGEHTQKEVADMMGISQSYISRLEKRIIGKLNRELACMA